MPCTYCGNPKHTRKQCEEFSNDFQTYLKVSTLVRQDYVKELTEKGIVPGAIVKTYNRTNNFMNKSSEVPVRGIGNLDMFSCYSGPGKKAFANSSPTREHIILDDDDERLVTPNHCYEIIEASNQDWATSWVTTQVLTEDEFKAMFKGKKRHIGFETSLIGCVVKKYTTHQETNEEMAARYNREAEEEKIREERLGDTDDGAPIYVVTAVSTIDCYKRPHTTSTSRTATNIEDATAIAAYLYLEESVDYDIPERHEDLFEEFKSEMSTTEDKTETCYRFFAENEHVLFEGEYVPKTFDLVIDEQQTASVSRLEIEEMIKDILET